MRRLERGEIFIPPFQRAFIWNLVEASRFIESLLLGLPVPGIFLAQEPETGKLLVIDGQQRLKTLQFFYQGTFDPRQENSVQRIFKLASVQPSFTGLTYDTLADKERINLDNSVIHATVVRQDAPLDDDTSMYHIFDRLNRGGRRLYPQEMRSALYQGTLIQTIKSLNDDDSWRNIYGIKSRRLKDQDLILRFLALYFDQEPYKRPMDEYLNLFAQRHRNPSEDFLNEASLVFAKTVKAFHGALGRKAFRLRAGQAFNAAVFDSMAVGLATRIKASEAPSSSEIVKIHDSLLADPEYVDSVSRSTSNEANVSLRLSKAKEVYAEL